jgi:hypothetical protein
VDVNTVIKRVVCQGADHAGVTQWCHRILGDTGWATSVQITSSAPYTLDPVIVLYDNVEQPIEKIELMIALRWA